jgi:hypothetical protein
LRYKLFCLTILFFLFLSILILLTSCKSENQQSAAHSFSKINLINNQKKTPLPSFFQVYQLPIANPKGEINRVIGWLNNHEIVYVTNEVQGSNLYRYDLKKGISKLLYESKFPIVTILISPDYNKLLIHSSPSTYEGQVSIINTEGKEVYSDSFPSVEMVFEWNQFNTEQLFITAFKADWSFTNYFLYLDKKELTSNDVRKPFAKWTGERRLAFLDWNENDISLVSPLIEKELGKEEILLRKGIFHFESFDNKILTITVESGEQLAKYTFYSKNMVEQFSFETPILSSYSGWVIPNYGMASDQKEFLTMIPLESTEADTYREGFQLISYNIKSGKKEILLENTENVPFTCSPNNTLCLMGYQFEKLFSLQNRTMTTIFNE